MADGWGSWLLAWYHLYITCEYYCRSQDGERQILIEHDSATECRLTWTEGQLTKMGDDAAEMRHGQREGWGGANGEGGAHPETTEELPNSQAVPLRIENLKQNLGRGWGLGNYNLSDQLHVLLLLRLGGELSDSVQREVITYWKLGLSLSPPRTPGTLQLISRPVIKGHLTFWKCVLDTWASLLIHSFSLPTELEQPVANGTCQALPPHMEPFYLGAGARAQRARLYPAVWLRGGGNWKHQDNVDYKPENWTCWEPENQ